MVDRKSQVIKKQMKEFMDNENQNEKLKPKSRPSMIQRITSRKGSIYQMFFGAPPSLKLR